jgi:hypothetical protein
MSKRYLTIYDQKTTLKYYIVNKRQDMAITIVADLVRFCASSWRKREKIVPNQPPLITAF